LPLSSGELQEIECFASTVGKIMEVRIGKLRIRGTLHKLIKLHSLDGYQYA